MVRWRYDYQPEAGTREADAMAFFRARDWLAEE
jgi:coproporphyrinogen III oxidase